MKIHNSFNNFKLNCNENIFCFNFNFKFKYQLSLKILENVIFPHKILQYHIKINTNECDM